MHTSLARQKGNFCGPEPQAVRSPVNFWLDIRELDFTWRRKITMKVSNQLQRQLPVRFRKRQSTGGIISKLGSTNREWIRVSHNGISYNFWLTNDISK